MLFARQRVPRAAYSMRFASGNTSTRVIHGMNDLNTPSGRARGAFAFIVLVTESHRAACNGYAIWGEIRDACHRDDVTISQRRHVSASVRARPRASAVAPPPSPPPPLGARLWGRHARVRQLIGAASLAQTLAFRSMTIRSTARQDRSVVPLGVALSASRTSQSHAWEIIPRLSRDRSCRVLTCRGRGDRAARESRRRTRALMTIRALSRPRSRMTQG